MRHLRPHPAAAALLPLLLPRLQVILTGGSAGGTSVFLALDRVAELVPQGARFVGVRAGGRVEPSSPAGIAPGVFSTCEGPSIPVLTMPALLPVQAPDAGFFIDAPLWNNATDFFFRDEFRAADAFWCGRGRQRGGGVWYLVSERGL
jgi:hypothetical protein